MNTLRPGHPATALSRREFLAMTAPAARQTATTSRTMSSVPTRV